MKKKFFFKFFLFTVIATMVTFTACKDYDDDISRLDNEIANLSGVKTDLAAVKADIATAQASAAAAQTAANDALAKANDALQAAQNAGDADAIEAAQTAADNAQTAADAAQAKADEVEAEAERLLGLIEALEGRVDALEALDSPSKQDLEDLKDEVALVLADVEVLAGKFNSMITAISFDYQGDDLNERDRDLNFSTTLARVDYTFVTGATNPFTFVKGQRQATSGVKIMVKVSPANAELNKDHIKLIRSDANADINNYVVASKVERAKPLLTRAMPTTTGLWEVTFDLPTSANLTEFRKLIKSPAPVKKYLFALAIENTVDQTATAEDRFVISDFAIALDDKDVTPEYDLTFDAKNATSTAWTNHTAIKNRYGVTDPVSGTILTDKTWTGGAWNTTATPHTPDGGDDRSGQPLMNVEVAKEFNVKITNTDIYGYYIALDKDYAVESAPSELIAWESYSITGLNAVHRADDIAKLTINSASAAGDVIGFRVYGVNWDGTLVDPDGKSFYVGVGASASTVLAFEQVIDAPMGAGATKASTIVDFTATNPGATTSHEFAMTIGHSVVLTAGDLTRLKADGTTTATSWADTKKLQITGVIPADLEEGKTYTGTLTLKNTSGIPIQVTNVTLEKVLPTGDLGITYKTNIHHDVNGTPVVYAYAKPDFTYNVVNALNVPAAMTNLEVANASTFPAASLPTWVSTTATVPVAEIGVPYLPAVAPGHGKIYDLTLSRNFGPVQYDATASAGTGKNYNLAWTGTPALKVEFRSYVQDLADWKYITTGTPAVEQTPVLKYGADLASYALSNITALPPAGSVAVLGGTTTLQDARTFTVTDVKVLTGANFDVVNEYFVPTLVGAPAATINFTAVITSVPASNVATKLEVTLTDNFGHDYTYVLPKVFDMTPN